jgi:hypothetical protein
MSENKPKFQKLTPIRDADIGIYREALDHVFEHDDLRNVAVSGAYSAGKSSVLESYKGKYTSKKFLHISLAHFQAPDEPEKGKSRSQEQHDPDTVKESVLEGKILNQLIHQIYPRRIPQTNFRIKQKISVIRLILWSAAPILFVLSLLHIIFLEKWKGFVGHFSTTWIKDLLDITTKDSVVLLSGAVCTVLTAIFLYHIIKAQINKGIFKKVSADKFEIEIFEGSDDSYFDKYLNEVLYLFDNCKADVIVFEDMDRYNANRIFERLREVNTLINTQRKQRHLKLTNMLFLRRFRKNVSYKPLRFFYLLRDDIFTTKDRTKFFDYIVPIVPVIDGSNSYDKVIEKFKEGGIYEKFDAHFLQKLSLYVDDMRLLLNIYNEFVVYESRINSTEQDWNKLLAMITYKNLFPRDFSELQLGRGYVRTVLGQKQIWIDKQEKELNALIDSYKKKISDINTEFQESTEELMTTMKAKQLTASSYFYGWNNISLNARSQTEYDRRNALIQSRMDESLATWNREIEQATDEIDLLSSKRFSNIALTDNSDEIFMVMYESPMKKTRDFGEIKENDYFDLLKFLLRFGWIDETCKDYMNYFYPNSLSVEDKIFLRSITDKKAKKINYTLKDPEKVLSYLGVFDFKQPETLNIYLMNHLLTHQEEYQEYSAVFFSYITETRNYRFIIGALGWSGIAGKELVNKINCVWPSFIEEIIGGAEPFTEDWHSIVFSSFVLLSLYHCPDKILQNVNTENCLTDYIQNDPRYLEFGQPISRQRSNEPNIGILIKRFDLLGVKFKSIDYEASNKDLFRQVYEHNQYEINKENLWLMMKVIYGLEETVDFAHKNLTVIMTEPESHLAKYVWDDIEKYMKAYLVFCDDAITDDEQVALRVLNCKDINEDDKLSYLVKLKTPIKSIMNVLFIVPFWKRVLELNLCDNTQENVLTYFERQTLDETLVDFINSHTALDYGDENIGTADIREKFFDAIIANNNIANEHYSLMLTSLGFYYDNFNVENVSKSKMGILIDKKIIRMATESLIFIREKYADMLLRYIEQNIAEYTDIMSEYLFIADEALNVLKLPVADEYKIALLCFIPDELTAINPAYYDAVRAHILLNNFNEDDLQYFVSHYTSEGAATKSAIILKVLDCLGLPFTEPLQMPSRLFDDIIQSGRTVSNDDKITLFSFVLPSLDESQCKCYLEQLGLNSFLSLFDQKRPKIEITETNTRLLGTFQEKGWITKFEEDEKENGYYRAYGRKKHSGKNEEQGK